MTDQAPLSDDEYREFMDLLKEGTSGDPVAAARAEALWNRHFALIQLLDPVRTAVHEAGHAIVGQALGFETQHLAILDDGNGEASRSKSIDLRLPRSEIPRSKIMEVLDYAAVAVAGHVAEEIEWGRARYPEWGVLGEVLRRWHGAAYQLRALAEKDRTELLPKPKEPTLIGMGLAIVQQGEQRAANILRRYRDLTRKLADALLAKRRLEGAELANLLANVGKSDGRDSGR